MRPDAISRSANLSLDKLTDSRSFSFMTKKSEDLGSDSYSFYLPRVLWDEMQRAARADGRSVSSWLARFLEKHFAVTKEQP